MPYGLASQGGPVQSGAVEKAHHRAAAVLAVEKTATPPTSPSRIKCSPGARKRPRGPLHPAFLAGVNPQPVAWGQ
jgi:hypothetical protein